MSEVEDILFRLKKSNLRLIKNGIQELDFIPKRLFNNIAEVNCEIDGESRWGEITDKKLRKLAR